jgi:polyisoprenoid-binding protein YceI
METIDARASADEGGNSMAQATLERIAQGVVLPAPGTYELDPAHTSVEFVARHIFTKVRGRFTDFSGTIEVAERPEDSSALVEISAASVQTDQEQRDGHLKSGDFFDVDTWPAITFRSTGVCITGEATFDLLGELTIRGVTNPVTFSAEYLGTDTNPFGDPVFAATARTTLEREDWDLTWNMVLESGGFLVSKTVDLEIEVEAKKVG